MGLTVTVNSSVSALDTAAWQQLVTTVHAPAFYDVAYLQSYERHPVGSFSAARYLTVHRDGDLVAVLPCYLQPTGDPLGILDGDPLPPPNPALLGHVWYCYDTRIPQLVAEPGLVEAIGLAVLDELARLRVEDRAAIAGLVNVAETDPIIALATRRGWFVKPMDTRWQLPLGGLGGFDDYLAGLDRKPRQNLARHLRRAQDANAQVSVVAPDRGLLAEVCTLCRLTAAKFGNEDFYAEERFADFVLGLGERALMFRVDGPHGLLAASVALVDARRLHMWALGLREMTVDGFSPHYVLWAAEIAEAFARGLAMVEGGRRNDPFKLRHGMRPLRLYACVTGA